MVDVGAKPITKRTATAAGTFITTREVIALVRADDLPKADVLATARIAGIQGAKRTSELIPLCHPLPLTSVHVDFTFGGSAAGDDSAADEAGDRITITASASTTGQTGVEMEALTAVAIAGLTLHDMTKAVDPGSVLTDIRVTSKVGRQARLRWRRCAELGSGGGQRGGARGIHSRCCGRDRGHDRSAHSRVARGPWLQRASRGGRRRRRAAASSPSCSPAVRRCSSRRAAPASRRATARPRPPRAVLDRELPGVAEAIRARGLANTPMAAISRGLAGVANGTLVVNLPGSTGGVKDGLAVLDDLLEHLVAQLEGKARMTEVLALISETELDAAALEQFVLTSANGALVTFRGVVRDHDHGQSVTALDYEAHPDAARFLETRAASSPSRPTSASPPRTAPGRSWWATPPSWPPLLRPTAPRRSTRARVSSSSSSTPCRSGSGSTWRMA